MSEVSPPFNCPECMLSCLLSTILKTVPMPSKRQSQPVISKYFLFISRPVGLPSLCLPACSHLAPFLGSVSISWLGQSGQQSSSLRYKLSLGASQASPQSQPPHLSPHTSHCKTKRIIDLHWFHFLLDLVVHG